MILVTFSQGAVSWEEGEEMLKKEARERFEDVKAGDRQATRAKCLEILQEIAAKAWRELTSHDLRKILLLRRDVTTTGARLCDTSIVQDMFDPRSPQVAVSYQWMASMGDIYDALCSMFEDPDTPVWLDIKFNRQGGSSLSTEAVIDITERTYLGCDTHVLVVHKGSDLTRLMQRGWILLEIGVRTASDRSMVKIIDMSGKRGDPCSQSNMSVWAQKIDPRG